MPRSIVPPTRSALHSFPSSTDMHASAPSRWPAEPPAERVGGALSSSSMSVGRDRDRDHQQAPPSRKSSIATLKARSRPSSPALSFTTDEAPAPSKLSAAPSLCTAFTNAVVLPSSSSPSSDDAPSLPIRQSKKRERVISESESATDRGVAPRVRQRVTSKPKAKDESHQFVSQIAVRARVSSATSAKSLRIATSSETLRTAPGDGLRTRKPSGVSARDAALDALKRVRKDSAVSMLDLTDSRPQELDGEDRAAEAAATVRPKPSPSRSFIPLPVKSKPASPIVDKSDSPRTLRRKSTSRDLKLCGLLSPPASPVVPTKIGGKARASMGGIKIRTPSTELDLGAFSTSSTASHLSKGPSAPVPVIEPSRPAPRLALQIGPKNHHTTLWDVNADDHYAWKGVLFLRELASGPQPSIESVSVTCASVQGAYAVEYDGQRLPEQSILTALDPGNGIALEPFWRSTQQDPMSGANGSGSGSSPNAGAGAGTSVVKAGGPQKTKKLGGWYARFWVPMPMRLFERAESREFRIEASVRVRTDPDADDSEEYATVTNMTVTHLSTERDLLARAT